MSGFCWAIFFGIEFLLAAGLFGNVLSFEQSISRDGLAKAAAAMRSPLVMYKSGS